MFMVDWFGREGIIYTAYYNGKDRFEIPYMIQMGWVFLFTMIIIIVVSFVEKSMKYSQLSLSNENEIIHSEVNNKSNGKLSPDQSLIIIIILFLVTGLYIQFW